jgi:hypothetical protein
MPTQQATGSTPMKTLYSLLALTFGLLGASAQSDPQIDSWLTSHSGKYARMYRTFADEQAGTAFTTWANTTYTQAMPAYAGVQEIAFSADYVYVRTTGLALGHIMGPWYNNSGAGGAQEVFQNWPEAIFANFRFPRSPSVPAQRTSFPPGGIGLMIDGTIIFSSSDTFSFDNDENGTGAGTDTGPGAQGGGMGDGIWSHDAVITEGNTFDKSNSHAAGNQLHYHAAPMKLRFVLEDSVQRIQQPNGEYLFSENPNGRHSPLLGWMNDGYPIYGPYAYGHPSDTNSAVRRMVTGFLVRDGQNGTLNIPSVGRTTLPDWAARFQGIGPALTINQQGPTHADIPAPYYMEDYAFKGDLPGFDFYDGTGTFSESQHYDLNEQNVRFCITPDFPNGTWAYFTCIAANGAPVFPYNVAVQYFGDPSQGGPVQNITENITTNWIGGPNAPLNVHTIGVNGSTITLAWNGVEGGSYRVESTPNLVNPTWTDVVTGVNVPEASNSGTTVHASTGLQRFYRVSRTAIADFDGTGSTAGAGGGGGAGTGGAPSISLVNPNSGIEGTTLTVNITIAGDMLPPASATPSAVTIGTVSGSSITYDGSMVSASFIFPAGTTGPQTVSVTFPPPPDQAALVITLPAGFTINASGGGGGTTPPSISQVNPAVGTEGTTVNVSLTLAGDMLPTVGLTPSVTVGAVIGTAVTYNGTTVGATLALPVGTTGAQNISLTFPAVGGGQAVVIAAVGGFTINAAGGGGGTPPSIAAIAPNTGTEGATVSVSITLTGDMLPPAEAPPNSVMIGTIMGSGVTYNGSVVTASFALPPGTTGAQNVTVTFPVPPGETQGLTVTTVGGFTIAADGGGGGTPPSIGAIAPNTGTEGATVSVSITLAGDMLPPAEAAPSSVMIGAIVGTGITYNGSVVTASFTLPPGTTGAQNVSVTFPAPPGGGQGFTVTTVGGFTINVGGGGGGTPGGNGILSVTPQTATRGATVNVSINLDPAANPMLPPANAPAPMVTVGGIPATGVVRTGNTVTATVAIPSNATTGAQEIVVAFMPPPGQQQGPSYNLTGVFTFN